MYCTYHKYCLIVTFYSRYHQNSMELSHEFQKRKLKGKKIGKEKLVIEGLELEVKLHIRRLKLGKLWVPYN